MKHRQYILLTYRGYSYHVFLENEKVAAIKLPGDHLDVTNKFCQSDIERIKLRALTIAQRYQK